MQELGTETRIVHDRHENVVQPVELSRLFLDLAREKVAVESRPALVARPSASLPSGRFEAFGEGAGLHVDASPPFDQDTLGLLLLLVVEEQAPREGPNLGIGGAAGREARRPSLLKIDGFSYLGDLPVIEGRRRIATGADG